MKKEESRKEISQKFFVLVVFKFGVFGVFEFCFFFGVFVPPFLFIYLVVVRIVVIVVCAVLFLRHNLFSRGCQYQLPL